MTTQLTSHFTLEEFEREGIAVPPEYSENVQQLAELLEAARSSGGGHEIDITSGYRVAAINAAVGGASTSQHLTASAADFVFPDGIDIVTWGQQVAADTSIPAWGQMILYPYSDHHIHLSLPGNHVRQLLVETGANQYTPWDGVSAVPQWGNPMEQPAGAIDAPQAEGEGESVWIGILLGVAALGLALMGV